MNYIMACVDRKMAKKKQEEQRDWECTSSPTTPMHPADRVRALGVELVPFDQAIAAADFISPHMPLTPTTNKLFNDETFPKMKKGLRIINVSRGGVIDEDALVRALDSGTVSQAALDVFREEPPPKDSRLVLHENVIVTPHLGASTKEAQEGVAIEIAEQ
ncbi:D-3-phosphoglycerate dehydrogenase 2, chloroplastic-like protein [Drosera capensis]